MALSWDQLLSLGGALLILLGYALQTFGPANAFARTYGWLNLLGSLGLTVTAIVNRQYGFILLEGMWAIISAYSLGRIVFPGRRFEK